MPLLRLPKIQIPKIKGRRLDNAERSLARQVFCDSINLDDIYIVNVTGLGGRAFVIPGELPVIALAAARVAPGLGPLIGSTVLGGPLGLAALEGIRFARGELTLAQALGDYLVCIGPDVFNNGAAADEATYIHELTHVWQGQHGFTGWEYIINSLLNQAADGNAAYHFTPGAQWDDYNAEQQASIVEAWFVNGMSTTDPLFWYIENDIRGGSCKGLISFHEGNHGRQDLVQSAGDQPCPGFRPRKNDEIRSLRLSHVRPGCVIRVFDAPGGRRNDDWCEIAVKAYVPEVVVPSFERSYEDSFVRVTYHRKNGLDGKVSWIEIA